MGETLREFDFGEVFTQAVRQVLCGLRRKPLVSSFDCRMPSIPVIGDTVALRCSLHRLLHGAMDLVDGGLVIFDAEAQARRSHLAASVRIAVTGGAHDAATDDVLSRLELMPECDDAGSRLRRAQGRCPRTGATIDFAALAGEGMLFKLDHALRLAPDAEPAYEAHADQARAWVVDADEPAGQLLVRRLQRLGWATASFGSMAQAQRRLQAMTQGQARPALVVAAESGSVTLADAQRLLRALPPSARCVFAVMPGSQTLTLPEFVPHLELRVLPLSPAEIRRWTLQLAGVAEAASGFTQPTPLLMQHRRKLLVVDDGEVNRLIASGIGETLGYEAFSASDGDEAIERCLKSPPDAVLMDIDMPRMSGIDATRRLRELQRRGSIVPFAILGVTSDTRPETLAQCLDAGMDTCLNKPLSRAILRAELRRVCGSGCEHERAE